MDGNCSNKNLNFSIECQRMMFEINVMMCISKELSRDSLAWFRLQTLKKKKLNFAFGLKGFWFNFSMPHVQGFPIVSVFFSTGNRIIRHHWHLHLVLITITRIHNTFYCCRNAQCQCSSFTMLFHWGGFPCMCTASLSYWPRRCSGCHLVAVTVNWSILAICPCQLPFFGGIHGNTVTYSYIYMCTCMSHF